MAPWNIEKLPCTSRWYVHLSCHPVGHIFLRRPHMVYGFMSVEKQPSGKHRNGQLMNINHSTISKSMLSPWNEGSMASSEICLGCLEVRLRSRRMFQHQNSGVVPFTKWAGFWSFRNGQWDLGLQQYAHYAPGAPLFPRWAWAVDVGRGWTGWSARVMVTRLQHFTGLLQAITVHGGFLK